MKFRGVDSLGDWQLGQGLGSYAKEQAALAIDIAARVRLRKGECFFSTNSGVDYANLLEKGRQADFESAMNNCILQTDGVVAINSITVTLDRATRTMRMSYDIQTIYSRSFKATLDNLSGAQT
jgi:hypothetical protein